MLGFVHWQSFFTADDVKDCLSITSLDLHGFASYYIICTK